MGSPSRPTLLVKILIGAVALVFCLGLTLGIGIIMSVNAFAADVEAVEISVNSCLELAGVFPVLLPIAQ